MTVRTSQMSEMPKVGQSVYVQFGYDSAKVEVLEILNTIPLSLRVKEHGDGGRIYEITHWDNEPQQG